VQAGGLFVLDSCRQLHNCRATSSSFGGPASQTKDQSNATQLTKLTRSRKLEPIAQKTTSTRPTCQTVAEDRSEASLCSYLLTIQALETRVDRSENYVDPPDSPNCRRRSIGGLFVLVPPNDPSSGNSSRSFRKLRRPARQVAERKL